MRHDYVSSLSSVGRVLHEPTGSYFTDIVNRFLGIAQHSVSAVIILWTPTMHPRYSHLRKFFPRAYVSKLHGYSKDHWHMRHIRSAWSMRSSTWKRSFKHEQVDPCLFWTTGLWNLFVQVKFDTTGLLIGDLSWYKWNFNVYLPTNTRMAVQYVYAVCLPWCHMILKACKAKQLPILHVLRLRMHWFDWLNAGL